MSVCRESQRSTRQETRRNDGSEQPESLINDSFSGENEQNERESALFDLITYVYDESLVTQSVPVFIKLSRIGPAFRISLRKQGAERKNEGGLTLSRESSARWSVR